MTNAPVTPARNFTDLLREAARRTPDAPAFHRRRWRSNTPEGVTHAGFVRTVDALSDRLIDRGIKPGQACSVDVKSHWGALAAAVAIASVGAAAAPPDDDEADWALVLAASTSSTRARRIIATPDWFQVPEAAPPPGSHARWQDASSVCAILRSSGTTGRPKRIAVTHDQMIARMARVMAAFPVPAEGRVACPMGPSGGYGFRTMVCALAGGASIVGCAGIEGTLEAIDFWRVTHLVVSPLLLEELVRARGTPAGPMRTLEVVEVGGSRLPDALRIAASRALCPNLVVSYGSSEAGVVAKGRADELAATPGAVGRLLDGIDAGSVDENDAPLPAGQVGTLRIRGPGCVDAYLGAQAATQRAFRDGWFHPGDRGCVTAGRILVIAGREREIINAGGQKIAPAAIEDALTGLPGVVEIAAFGAEDDLQVVKPWVAIVIGADFNESAFREACRDRLGPLAPAGVLVLRALPRNQNGKVVRGKLVELVRKQARGGRPTLH